MIHCRLDLFLHILVGLVAVGGIVGSYLPLRLLFSNIIVSVGQRLPLRENGP